MFGFTRRSLWSAFTEDVTKLLLDGDNYGKEEITVGLENAHETLAFNMKGKNLGKIDDL